MHKVNVNALENERKAIKLSRAHDSRLSDTRKCTITLKQWKMLHAVIDCGGFAEAAKYLNITQSGISYTIAKLQEQLGISVLKIEGRKAQLTSAGRELLKRSRHLIKDAAELELFAENLCYGWESEIRLLITQDLPPNLLMSALRRFSQYNKNIKVVLTEAPLMDVEKALFDRTVDLIISSFVPFGCCGTPLVAVEWVAVAHTNSPLLKIGRPPSIHDLERQIQIVVAGSKENQYKETSRPSEHSQQWSVCNLDTAIAALCEGIGYAWLPKHRIQKCLSQGELSLIPLSYGNTYTTTLYLISARPLKLGSSFSTLEGFLKNAADENTTEEDIWNLNKLSAI